MGKIYMTACMKGGCAKTVTTYNLAYSLKELGRKYYVWILIARQT